jgi:hypothetical protein
MTRRIQIAFGIGSMTASVIASAAYVCSVSLPYHLSSCQGQFLDIALGIQFIAAIVAVVLGITGIYLGRHKRFGKRSLLDIFAVIFGMAVLCLVIFTVHEHSRSHKVGKNDARSETTMVSILGDSKRT